MSQQGTIRCKTTKATATKKGVKRWHVCWFVMDPATGQRRQRTQVAESYKEAVELRNKMVTAVDEGRYQDPVRMTVAELLLDHWLPSLRKKRPNTVSSYRTVADKWLIPKLGGYQVRALTPKHIGDALDHLKTSGGRNGTPLSGRSQQYAVVVLSMALKFAVVQGLVPRNVAAQVERPDGAATERPAWTAEEARAFLGHVSDHRLYVAWLLFLTRGFRRGELAGLRWSDVRRDPDRAPRCRARRRPQGARCPPRRRVQGRRTRLGRLGLRLRLRDRRGAHPRVPQHDVGPAREDVRSAAHLTARREAHGGNLRPTGGRADRGREPLAGARQRVDHSGHLPARDPADARGGGRPADLDHPRPCCPGVAMSVQSPACCPGVALGSVGPPAASACKPLTCTFLVGLRGFEPPTS